MKKRILRGDELPSTSGGIYTFLNPHTYLVHRQDPSVLLQFDGLFIDGILLVQSLRVLGLAAVRRASFDMTSMAPVVFSSASDSSKSVYFVGTRSRLIAQAVELIRRRYPDLKVAGYRDGYFHSGDDLNAACQRLTEVRPDIVVAGMGAPRQEQFLVRLQASGWRGLGFTCGGFLEQTAKRIDYYPSWVDRFGLRWAYRLYDDPTKWKRFLRYYPEFPVAIAVDYIRHVRAKEREGLPD